MRVLLIGNQSLFGQGLKNLLAQEGLELIDHVAEAEGVEDQVRSLQPDVAIVVCGAGQQEPSPALMRCLAGGLVQKVISVSLEDNTLFVYNGCQCVVKTIDDFFAEIRQLA